MPDTASSTSATGEIDRAVKLLNRSLRRLHVSRSDRQWIIDDVRGDLGDWCEAARSVGPVTKGGWLRGLRGR
jgi:hypothetical protein